MNRNRIHFLYVAVLIVAVSVGLYFLLDAIYQLPVAASAEAGPIDQLADAHFIMIAFLFSLIMVFMIYSAVVFRRKEGDDTDGAHFHGNTALEIGWTVVPLIIVLGFGAWGTIVLGDITEAGENEMVVNVTGRQWSWLFSYPDYEEAGQSQELVLPVNRTIRLRMNSNDVLHSFWVPEFRVKQDLVPGMETTLRITPTEIGEYTVRCAEICGFDHAKMLAPVRVVSEADFLEWVSTVGGSLGQLTPEERGGKWAVDYGCISCHSIYGSPGGIGPSWAGLFGREEMLDDGTTVTVDEEYLRQSILNPGSQIVTGYANVMPANFEEQFTQTEMDVQANDDIEVDIVDDLIAYIMTLSAAEAE